jgi:hypothetical protein
VWYAPLLTAVLPFENVIDATTGSWKSIVKVAEVDAAGMYSDATLVQPVPDKPLVIWSDVYLVPVLKGVALSV